MMSDHLHVTAGHICYATEHEVPNAHLHGQVFEWSRDSETWDELEPPSNGIRLCGSSTRALQAVTSQVVTFFKILPSSTGQLAIISGHYFHVTSQNLPHYQQPNEQDISWSEETQDQMVEPADKSTASTSGINRSTFWRETTMIEQSSQPTTSTSRINQTGTLWRKVMRTASSNSLSSIPMTATVRMCPLVMTPLLTVYRGFSQPLAYNFFNPVTDLTTGDLSAPLSSRSLGLSAEQGPVNQVQVTQPFCRLDSLSHRGSLLSFSTPNSFAPSPCLQSHFSVMTVCEPSSPAHTIGYHNHPASMCTEMVTLHSTDKDGYRSISFSHPWRYQVRIADKARLAWRSEHWTR